MKTAFIHIGTHKTGTTTIQHSLYNSNLKEQNICYPSFSEFPNARNQNFLSILFKDYEELPRIYKKYSKEEYLKLKKSIQIELKGQLKKYDNTIISAEMIDSFSRNETTSFLEFLTAHSYTDIKILVYVRNPVYFYTSHVQQTIKASYVYPSPTSFKYEFRSIIETWRKDFQKLSVKLYDEELQKNNGLLKSFERELQQQFNFPVILVESSHKNKSLSLESMVILKKYRKLFHSNSENFFKKDSSKLLKHLTDITDKESTKLQLKEEVAQHIYNEHKADLLWLKQRFNLEFQYPVMNEHRIELLEKNSYNTHDLFQNFDSGKIEKCLYHVLQAILSHN